MSFRHEGLKCSVCHSYLFEDDDVVYCPECGAPHHRSCYTSIGHCALEDTHGTDMQYDLKKAREESQDTQQEKEKNTASFKENEKTANIRCFGCGNEYPSDMSRCPRCSTPNPEKTGFGGFGIGSFDFLGGVPADMDLGKGVTADEAKRFVVSNTHRYIPKFASMIAGTKASWNWFAFLFPPAWFMSRKMYKQGILSGILIIALTLLTLPFLNSIAYLDTTSARNYFELAQLISENLDTVGAAAFILAAVGSMLNILLRVLLAIFADYSYKNHTVDTVAQIKQTADNDKEADFRKKGGTSFLGLLIGFFAVEYLPSIIAMFL